MHSSAKQQKQWLSVRVTGLSQLQGIHQGVVSAPNTTMLAVLLEEVSPLCGSIAKQNCHKKSQQLTRKLLSIICACCCPGCARCRGLKISDAMRPKKPVEYVTKWTMERGAAFVRPTHMVMKLVKINSRLVYRCLCQQASALLS